MKILLLCLFAFLLNVQGTLVRLVNTVPDAPTPLSFYVNGKNLVSLPFTNVSSAYQLPGGSTDFMVTLQGSPTPLFRGTFSLASGKNYTVNAIGSVSAGTVTFLMIFDPSPIDPGKYSSFVSFFNAAVDTTLDLYVGPSPLYTNVGFGTLETSFQVIIAQSWEISIKDSSTSQTLGKKTIDFSDVQTGIIYAEGKGKDSSPYLVKIY